MQEAAYDQLYPMLVGLRDQAQAQGPNPMTAQAAVPDPKPMTKFFSGMDYSHFQPQPKPNHGVPAAPAALRPDGGSPSAVPGLRRERFRDACR